jgi:hypothetical protein
MNRVVFDIETLAYPFDSFDSEQQAYLLNGMLNPDSNQGKVFHQSTDRKMPYRYTWAEHCDLMEQLKGNGITGLDLRRLVEEGRHKEIAEYCLGFERETRS